MSAPTHAGDDGRFHGHNDFRIQETEDPTKNTRITQLVHGTHIRTELTARRPPWAPM